MVDDVDRLLAKTAAKGSWYGGGSAAALCCALAAALIEKLARQPRLVAELRAIRRRGVMLVDRDAETFARVIRAFSRPPRQALSAGRGRNWPAVRRALKASIEIPWKVFRDTRRLLVLSRAVRQTISPRYRVDLDCAAAIAKAAGASARALMMTNLAWLEDPAYSRRIRQQIARLT